MLLWGKMKIIKNLFIMLLVLFFAQGAFAASYKTIKFAQLTDIHYLPQDVKTQSARVIAGSDKNLYFAVNSINKQDVAFTVFLGDNIDKSNSDYLKAFLEQTTCLTMPYYLVLGNHDVHKIGGITKEDYMTLVRKYNRNQKSPLSYYTFKPNNDILCVVMDGATPFAPSKHGIYTEEKLKWLDALLTNNSKKIVLIFQHFPLIAPTDNVSHSVLESDDYKDILIKHDNVAVVSSGHYHTDKVQIDDDGIYHISAPALVNCPSTYEVINFQYKKYNGKGRPDFKIDIERIKL